MPIPKLSLIFLTLVACGLRLGAENFTVDPTFARPVFHADPASATQARSDSLGRVYLMGNLSGANGHRLGRIVRIDGATGAVDPTFVLGSAIAEVHGIQLDSMAANPTTLRRIGVNGGLDASFAFPAIDGLFSSTSINALTRTPAGLVLLPTAAMNGRAHFVGGGVVGSVIALDESGVAPGFVPPALECESFGVELTLQAGLRLASGTFDRVGSTPASPIVRLRADGTTDPTFAPPSGLALWQSTSAVAISPDGAAYVAYREDFNIQSFAGRCGWFASA